MEIRYQEVKLAEVLKFFADAFRKPKDGKIASVEPFVDTGKGVVVFKLFVDKEPDNKPG